MERGVAASLAPVLDKGLARADVLILGQSNAYEISIEVQVYGAMPSFAEIKRALSSVALRPEAKQVVVQAVEYETAGEEKRNFALLCGLFCSG